MYNYDNDDKNDDKNMQNTTKNSDAFDIHDEAQDAESEKRGKVVRGRLRVSAQDHPHENTKKSDASDIHDEAITAGKDDKDKSVRGKVVRGRRKVSAQDHPQKQIANVKNVRNQRGHGKRKPSAIPNIKMFSTNGAGIIGGKVKSLVAEVKHTKCNIVTVQETHCRTKGKLAIENFVIFEAIRKAKGGGPTLGAIECMLP